MTALPNKCYSGHHKATKKEDDQETRGKKIWRGRCGQRASGLDGGRWRRQHKIELDGDEWSVAYAPLGATRHKSSKASKQQNHILCHPLEDLGVTYTVHLCLVGKHVIDFLFCAN